MKTNQTDLVNDRSKEWIKKQFWLLPASRLCVVVSFSLGLSTANTFGEGFRNPPPGTFNLGRAGGRIAQIDDSSAIQQNPANLMDLASTEIQFTPTVVYFSGNFQSPTGQSSESTDPWHALPNLFISTPLADGKFSLGLGVTTPYGIACQWDQSSSAFAPFTGILRYTSPYMAELKTINFNPSVAVKLGEHFQVGAGLDVMWSQLTLKQFYPWFMVTGNFADPDGNAEAKGDGVGLGGNLGITWKINDRNRIAVTYRSPISVNYDGNFTLNNVPAVFGGGSLASSFNSRIQFPTIVSAGYGLQLSDTIRLETDFEWLQFANFNSLPVTVGSPPPGLPTSVTENWKNTFTAGIGGDWRFAPDWVLRLGYQYYESPVPDQTISPAIPDANQNVITFGVGYHHKHVSVEAAYGLDFYATRNISNDQNPAFNGEYSLNVHLFSFAFRYTF